MSPYRATQLSKDEIDEAIQDYLRGESADDIAVSLGISSDTVLRWVRKAGGTVRRKGPGATYLERVRDRS